MSDELLRKKEKILNDVKKHIPGLYETIRSELDNLENEDDLKTELDLISKELEATKNVIDNESKEENDNAVTIKDDTDSEINKSLKEATKDFIDFDPIQPKKASEYSKLKKCSLTYSKEKGYSVIEDLDGGLRGILQETTYYLYPNPDMEINEQNLKVLNTLFGTKDGELITENSEINYDSIYPAQVVVPYTAGNEDEIKIMPNSRGYINRGIIEKKEKVIVKEDYEDIYGFTAYLKKAYGIDSVFGYDKSEKISYINAYKNYLETLLENQPETEEYVVKKVKEMNLNIEKLKDGRIF